jgi:hypothetical protein
MTTMLLGLVCLAIQLVPYAVATVSFPFLPFLMPLLLAPVVIGYGLLILGAGTGLAVLGLAKAVL